jgi:histone-lysine N-methyltransferase ASH1L
MDTLLPARALSAESSFGGAADVFSNVASLSSTPPTTVADSISLASEASKHEITSLSDPIEEPVDDSANIVAAPEPMDEDHTVDAIEASPDAPEPSTATSTPADTPQRIRRHRASMPVYNLAKLSGTAIHGKRAANGDIITTRRRRTISGDTLVDNDEDGNVKAQSTKTGSSKKRARSPEPPQRATRSSGLEVENLARKISSLGKKGKKTFEKSAARISRELKRIIDTNEYAGIDTKPVLYTTWAKGKLVTAEAPGPARKKAKVTESPKKAAAAKPERVEAAPPSGPGFSKRRVKKWLDHGLYSGQDAPVEVTKHLTPGEKKTLAELPELVPSAKLNKALPAPIFNGLRLLLKGRDFRLPFDVCSPLPPGQPKPEEWRKMTRSKTAIIRRIHKCMC